MFQIHRNVIRERYSFIAYCRLPRFTASGIRKKDSWDDWINFFESKKDVFWPQRNINDSEECPPELVNVPPHSRPVPDPRKSATLEVAAMYANGLKEPEMTARVKC